MNKYRHFMILTGTLVWPLSLLTLLLIALLLASFGPQPAWASNLGNKGRLTRTLTTHLLSRSSKASGIVLVESFDGVIFPPTNWGTTIVTGTMQGWSQETAGFAPVASPHNGTGMAQFSSFLLPSNYSSRLYTPLLDFTGQTTPTLTFWMYHDTGYPSSNDRLLIQISTDGGNNYTTTLASLFRYDGSIGWKWHSVDLSAYSGQSNIRLGILGISDFGNHIFMDDLRVGPPPIFSNIYLPLVVKPAPIPPDGHWTGTTSRNQPMSFDVSNGGTIWRIFKLKTNFVLGSCNGTVEVTVSGPGSISNNQFIRSGSNFSFSGQLTSPQTASGTYTFVNQSTGCGLLTQSGTWTANLP